MKCKKCGYDMKDGSKFCVGCGSRVEDITTLSFDSGVHIPAPEVKSLSEYKNTSTNQDLFAGVGGNQKPKKSGKKVGLLIALAALLLTLIGAVIFCIFSFPFRAWYSSVNDIDTKTITVRDLGVSVRTNQPIKSVGYSVDPKDYTNMNEYTEIPGSGLYSREFIVPEFNIPVGESKLYICTTGLFGGKAYHEINLKMDIGGVSAPDLSKIIEYAEGKKILSNELVIVAEDGVTEMEIESLVNQYGGEVVGAIYPVNQYQVRFVGEGVDYLNNLKAALEQSPLIKSVIYNAVQEMAIDIFPRDSHFDSWTGDKTNPDGNNWGLECINAPVAWDYNNRMQVVKVGVIDSYLDYDHEDLNIDRRRFMFMPSNDFATPEQFWDYYTSTSPYHVCSSQDCEFCSAFKDHGTHVAGIIGAVNNDNGICGVNWNTDVVFASLWHLLKDPSSDSFIPCSTTSSFNMAFTHCVLSNCRVINMSFGTMPTAITAEEIVANQVFDDMVRDFENRGYDFLILKSAGNGVNGSGVDAATCSTTRMLTFGENARAHTIVVGAIWNHRNRYPGYNEIFFDKTQFSNYGEVVDIMAPGYDILSTICEDDYALWDGTSMATPMVAGAASLIYSLNPDITYDYVKALICCVNDSWCIDGDIVYPVLDAGNAVEYAIENGWTSVNTRLAPIKPPLGYVHGVIQDAETEMVLPNATLVCRSETGDVYTVGTYQGLYQCQLPEGIYDMEFSCLGYISETIYDVEVTTDVITYNILLNMVQEGTEKGIVKGQVIDAFDASAVQRAAIKIYKGINCTTGTPVLSLTADNYGFYTAELEPGNYTVTAAASGYLDGYANVLSISGRTKENQNCTITPILNPGEIRVILTWGQHPYDLDSHIVGPAPGGRFHTYFASSNYYYQGRHYCNLDVDDTSSYGPETTSVYVGVDGTYTFYVHDYTNRASNNSTALANSGAQVKVYVAGAAAPKVFNVPNRPGTVWQVCSIKDGEITPINNMTFVNGPENVGSGASVR